MTHFYIIGFAISIVIFLIVFVWCIYLRMENYQLKQRQYPRAERPTRQQKKEFTQQTVIK